MSTQSGITPSPELLSGFSKFVEAKHPIFTAKIEKETMVSDSSYTGSVEQAFAELRSELDDSTPRYIVVKHKADGVYTFVAYVPDYAPVKEKMLYASSKNTLIRQLGSDLFPHILFLNALDDLTHSNWQYLVAGTKKELLSAEEQELEQIKEMEFRTKLQQSTTKKPLVAATNSLALKLNDNADIVVEDNRLYSFNIDLNTEEVFLSNSAPVSSADQLPSLIASDYPQYNLVKLQGKAYFIFSCPSGSKVRERMIYASNRNSVIGHFKQVVGIDKSIEVGDAVELELSEFSDEVKQDAGGLKFNRPSRPGRRG